MEIRIPSDQTSSPKKQGFLGYLHFFSMFSLARKANAYSKQNKSLTPKDLPDLPWHERPDILEGKIAHHLKLTKRSSASLAILKAVKWPLALWLVIHLVFLFFRIFTAWMIKRLIECYSDPTLPSSEAFKWTGILCSSTLR